jgi:hypothetical protein
MEKLFFECQKESPCVHYDKEQNIFEISGKSFAKYSRHIYKDVLDWLNEYIKKPNKETIVSFKFEFYDTSSAKMILEILKKLDWLYSQKHKVEIHWYFPEDDDDIEEAGEIYSNLINAPVKVIPFSLETS